MTQTRPPFMIDWSSRSKMRGPGEQSLGKLLQALRDRLAPEAQGISLTYVDDRGMRKLNREHRGKNLTTDVLSFPSSAEKAQPREPCLRFNGKTVGFNGKAAH